MPVCGIAGEFDCLGLPDVALQGQALLRTRPDARFHLVPRAGHWVNYEAADAFNSILLAELGR
jgi:pimeloyl-ACP methyl ester carboxylesterase